MKLQLTVPSIVCSGCVDTVTKAIKAVDPAASVTGDPTTKIVEVETEQSQEKLVEAIVATGHTVS
jgi:copper chaperone